MWLPETAAPSELAADLNTRELTRLRSGWKTYFPTGTTGNSKGWLHISELYHLRIILEGH